MSQEITIYGYVGGDPVQRFTPQGEPVTQFSIADSRKIKEQSETVWFRVTAWGKLAETCGKYLTKGMKAQVKGQLSFDPESHGPRMWKDKTTGEMRTSFEVKAYSVEWASGKAEAPESEDW